jgi:hypothetical protein
MFTGMMVVKSLPNAIGQRGVERNIEGCRQVQASSVFSPASMRILSALALCHNLLPQKGCEK